MQQLVPVWDTGISGGSWIHCAMTGTSISAEYAVDRYSGLPKRVTLSFQAALILSCPWASEVLWGAALHPPVLRPACTVAKAVTLGHFQSPLSPRPGFLMLSRQLFSWNLLSTSGPAQLWGRKALSSSFCKNARQASVMGRGTATLVPGSFGTPRHELTSPCDSFWELLVGHVVWHYFSKFCFIFFYAYLVTSFFL